MQEPTRILIVKTSSLGDVVHCLPVVSDLARQLPQARVDWLVEEDFAAIPRAHPFVDKVIPATFRRWRRQPFASNTRREFNLFREALRGQAYDAVIDAQGLLKSAFLQRFASLGASGRRHGYADPREPMAARFYDQRHAIAWGQHAVRRNRLLSAAALGYRLSDAELAQPEYGLRVIEVPAGSAERTAVLLHGTSRPDKEWPEAHWLALVAQLGALGLACVLPAGSAMEAGRAARIAAAHPQARALAPGALETLVPLLGSAACAVGVDTGLTHLAAAFGVPTVALFAASDPALTGVCAVRAENLTTAVPDDVMAALQRLGVVV